MVVCGFIAGAIICFFFQQWLTPTPLPWANRPGLWRVDGGNPHCQIYARVEYGRGDKLYATVNGSSREFDESDETTYGAGWYFITDQGISTLTVEESNRQFYEGRRVEDGTLASHEP